MIYYGFIFEDKFDTCKNFAATAENKYFLWWGILYHLNMNNFRNSYKDNIDYGSLVKPIFLFHFIFNWLLF